MLNKEKIKNFLVNPEFKFWTIAALLLVIISFQASCYLGAKRVRRFMRKGTDLYSVFLKENNEFLKNDGFKRDKIRQLEKKLNE
jgi:hypothetical protein